MTNTSGEQAMRQLSKIACVAILSLTIHGCSQSDAKQGSDTTPSAPLVAKQPAAEPFAKPPMLSQQPQESLVSSASGFIQPTNGNQRAKQVQKGRRDPFAGLFVAPRVVTTVVPPRIVPQSRAPRIEKSPRTAVRLSSPSPRVDTVSPSTPPTPTRSIPLPPVTPGSPTEAVLPPPPQEPDLAKSVAISGVVQIGDQYEAILKVPNEATSRYVKVGQRLANGQVLVKRIEMNQGSDPVVILEQYGIEVARAVGEQIVNPASTPAPTGENPAPTPAPSTGENSPPAPIDENSAPAPAPVDQNSAPAPIDENSAPAPAPIDETAPTPTPPTEDNLDSPASTGTSPTDDNTVPPPPTDSSSLETP